MKMSISDKNIVDSYVTFVNAIIHSKFNTIYVIVERSQFSKVL